MADIDFKDFRKFVLKQNPNLKQSQLEDLDDFILNRQAVNLVKSGDLAPSDIPTNKDQLKILVESGGGQKNEGLTSIDQLQSAGERRRAQDLIDFLRRIQSAQSARVSPEGKVTSSGPLTSLFTGIAELAGKSTKSGELRDKLTDIVQQIRKERTGVAFKPEEKRELERTFGSIFTQEAPLERKLGGLEEQVIQSLLDLNLSPELLRSRGLSIGEEEYLGEKSETKNTKNIGGYIVEY